MTALHITVRRPRRLELPALAKLFRQAVAQNFGYFPQDYQSQIIRENNFTRLIRASFDSSRAVYIAAHKNKLVGYIIAGQGNGEGHVYWLFVEPEARGEDLGSRLLERALHQLKQQGTKRVVLNTHDHQNYYLNHGFSAGKTWQFHGVPVTNMSRELEK